MANGSLFLESPNLVSVTRIPAESPIWTLSEQICDLSVIYVWEEGQGEFTIAGKSCPVQGGSLVILNPQLAFRAQPSVSHPLKGYEIRLSGFHLASKPKECLIMPGDPAVYRIHRERSEIFKYLNELMDEYNRQMFGYQDMLASLLAKLLILFLRTIENQKADAAASIPQTVKTYIEAHYIEELTLSDLANVVFVSPYYLAHIFKEEIGIPPIQYLILCRIEEAKKLLVQTHLSVIEIASQVGYENANYFNLIFKKMTGLSPGKYRKEQGS